MKIRCKIFGHEYYVYAKPNEDWATGIRWLKCDRCKRDFFINSRVRTLLPYDPELEDMHKWLIVLGG